MTRARWAAPALLTAVLAAALAAWLWLRTPGPLYCFTDPGQIWGAAAIPPGVQPECPQSPSYRRELLSGAGRTEQFRLSGWQPRALLPTFQAQGFVQRTDDLLSDDYSAFLTRGTERIQYSALRDGTETLITVSGPPAPR